MDKFSVGEIAILTASGTSMDGVEVEVAGPLEYREWTHFQTMEPQSGIAYLCHVPGEWRGWACRPQYLRKRRPPQDWVKLCRLNDLPREVEHV